MPDLRKKVLFAAAGTGGHLFPAQALAEQLTWENGNVDLLFAGAYLSANPWFDKEKFRSCEITSASFFQGKTRHRFRTVGRLLKGIWQSLRLLLREKPDLVIGFGSFHVFPLLCAAVIKRVPLILFESNSVPGKVVRLFSKRALFCGIYFSSARKHLKGKTVNVEIPGKRRSSVSKKEALVALGLNPDRSTLLVFGGSQGAQKINQTMIGLLPQLKKANPGIQLIHFTGSEETAHEVFRLCQELEIPACVKKFEKQMEIAWSASDLVLCRSGAMTLSELLAHEVPGILIPYPAASDQHQLKNALFLEQTVGGAIHFTENPLRTEKLLETLIDLTTPGSAKRSEMQNAIRQYKVQQQKEDMAGLVRHYLNQR